MKANLILQGLGIFADFITVISIWGFGESCPVWLRILVTILLIIATLLFIIAEKRKNDVEKIHDYALNDDGTLTHIFIKKNENYQENTLVSIYMKDTNLEFIVGIGLVTSTSDDKNIQVKIIYAIDESAINKMWRNKSNIKSYFTRSRVRYTDINTLESAEI